MKGDRSLTSDETAFDERRAALVALLKHLRQTGYHFVTPTPATHALVLARKGAEARSLTDVLGWSLPFSKAMLNPTVWELLEASGSLRPCGEHYRATLRVSSLKGHLFLHSAYPTLNENAVFFGPDSYRFADLLQAELGAEARRSAMAIFDMGTGSGVGAVIAAGICPKARVFASDVNPEAVRLATVNAAAVGVPLDVRLGADLAGATDEFDIITMNPPYIIDPSHRLYRDGGGLHGAETTLTMAAAACGHLAPGGMLIIYSGSAIVGGEDRLYGELQRLCRAGNHALRYRELDPDVFGEELENPGYADVDRIALVAATITRTP